MEDELTNLKLEISFLRHELTQLKDELRLISSFLKDIQEPSISSQTHLENLKNQQKITLNELKITQKALKEHISTHKLETSTLRQITSTTSTDNLPLQALKSPNMPISTGNEGASTDRQTNQQTDKHPLFAYGKMQKNAKNTHFEQKYEETPENLLKIASGAYLEKPISNPCPAPNSSLEQASELLANLDSLKKQIRFKFKALTPQEFKVFSAIYQLEEQHLTPDYALLSKKLHLSESSIRDYISRIISKGIPILKEKINNKQVIVHISSDLKKIASLAAILQLREL